MFRNPLFLQSNRSFDFEKKNLFINILPSSTHLSPPHNGNGDS